MNLAELVKQYYNLSYIGTTEADFKHRFNNHIELSKEYWTIKHNHSQQKSPGG